jgi:hypothetical protein
MMRCPEQMAPQPKEIPHEAVDRHKALRLSDRFESSYLALALASRLMRQFGPIVLILRRAVYDRRHHATVGRRVAAQLIGDQPAGRPAFAFQQLPEEPSGGLLIAPRLRRMSITSPSWSTARHKYCRRP